MKSCTVIAGCGYVGKELASQLTELGGEVYGIVRSDRGAGPHFHPLIADVTERHSLESKLPEHTTALVYAVSASEHSDSGYERAYVQGLTNMIEACKRRGTALKRIVFVSSSGVYAQNSGEWVDENSPAEPQHFSGRRMLEGEKICLASPYRSVVLRLAGIYGPGRTALIEQVRQGEAVCFAGPPRYSNRIHRDDCAGVLQHILQMEDPEEIYLGVDNLPEDRSEVVRWIARRLGAAEPQVVEPGTREGRIFGTNKRCRNRRLQDSGYKFRYPSYVEGYAEICDAITDGRERFA